MWVPSSSWEDCLEKEMATHFTILAGKTHGHRSLVGYSLWVTKVSDTTEQLSTQAQTQKSTLFFSNTCIKFILQT